MTENASESPDKTPSDASEMKPAPEPSVAAAAASAVPPQADATSAKPAAADSALPASPAAVPTAPPAAVPAPAPKPAAALPPASKEAPLPSAPDKATADAPSHVKCPNCGKNNRVGVLICEFCGSSLLGESSGLGTKKFGQNAKPTAGTAIETDAPPAERKEPAETAFGMHPPTESDTNVIAAAVKSAGSDVFSETMMLRLEIEGYPTPILIYPKAETTLGRRDPSTGTMPDVDLTTYAGYRLGVSRKHAVIQLKQKRIEIYDLGSSNGTHINGVRLDPHKPAVIRDGDEIILGKMVMRALFQNSDRT